MPRWFRKKPVPPREVNVKIKLPFVGEFSGTWEPQRAESEAAWELYVELVTRISVVQLGRDEGLAREALSSLYTLFGSTREILRKYGPAVATRLAQGEVNFGALAIAVLNGNLRPLLTRWHPRLRSWESRCPDGADPIAHENAWEHIDALRTDLDEARRSLIQTADILAQVAGAAPLTTSRPQDHLRENSSQNDGGG